MISRLVFPIFFLSILLPIFDTMGVFTNDRKKRNLDPYTLTSKIPLLTSHFSDSYSSKKTKLLISSNQAHDSPMEEARVSVISRFHQYPDFKSQVKREPHAPVRPSKFGGHLNFRSSGLKSLFSNRGKWKSENWSSLRLQYDGAKHEAFKSLRYVNKDKDIVEVKDDEVVEVVNLDGGSFGDSRDLSIKVDVRDEKVADVELRESSSPDVRNDTVANLRTLSAEKILDSLSLAEEGGDNLGLVAYKKMFSDVNRKYQSLPSLQFRIEITEKKRVALQEFRPQRKVKMEAKTSEEETSKKEMTELAFKPLTKDEENQVASAFANHQRWEVLVTHEGSNIDITGDLLRCLRPKKWLNDEVINLYLELLKEREKREPQMFLKCHFFNTFFYKKLVSGKDMYNFQSVQRWTTERKLGYFIFDCDKIFIPIHKEIHWCLAVINKKEEKFQYLDSLGNADSHVLNVLARYFVDEVKEKSGKEIDVSSWKQEFIDNLPEQKNGFDCGVFMIKYADFYSRDIGLCFNQKHMPYFRQRTAKEILTLKAE